MKDGRYQHPQFSIVQNLSDLPPVPGKWPGEGCLSPANVAVAISLGATALDILSLNVQFSVCNPCKNIIFFEQSFVYFMEFL